MRSGTRVRRRSARLMAAVAATSVALTAAGGSAQAHIALDERGRFRHQDHTGRLTVWNDVDHSAWWRATRRAQINWDKTMAPLLEFDTASSLRSSVLHVLDGDYGQTGWIGYADEWAYHGGHGHPRLNLHYGRRRADDYLQKVACHELGHFAGLAHSDDASDCMRSGPAFESARIGSVHARQLRSRWTGTGH